MATTTKFRSRESTTRKGLRQHNLGPPVILYKTFTSETNKCETTCTLWMTIHRCGARQKSPTGPEWRHKMWPAEKGRPACHRLTYILRSYLMVTLTGLDAMPLVTTSNWLAPFSILAGTSNSVETMTDPVATPMELKS